MARFSLTVFLTSAAIIAASVSAQAQQSPPQQQSVSEKPAQPAAPDQRGTDQMPLTVKILSSDTAADKAKKEQEERAEKDEALRLNKSIAADTTRLADETKRLTDYTGLLMVFTAFLFAVAVLQIAGLVAQLRYMKVGMRDAKVAAEAAKIGAIATRDTVLTAREAMQLDQRAWVGVDSIQPMPLIPVASQPFLAKITFKNTGKTPARKVIGYAVSDPIASGQRPNFDYSKETQTISSGHMEPGQTLSATLSFVRSHSTGRTHIPITQEILNQIVAGKIKLYVHGRIDYEDIFGRPHWLKFCSVLMVPFNECFGIESDYSDYNNSDDYQPLSAHGPPPVEETQTPEQPRKTLRKKLVAKFKEWWLVAFAP